MEILFSANESLQQIVLVFESSLEWDSMCSSSKQRAMDDSFTDLFEKTNNILNDLGQANDDIVGVDVAERGVVTALTPYLV